MENMKSCEHTVIIENRNKLNLSGVIEVLSFDEQIIVLKTQMGDLTIKGESLKVNCFAVESGNLILEGNLFAMAYSSQSKRNIKSRLFG